MKLTLTLWYKDRKQQSFNGHFQDNYYHKYYFDCIFWMLEILICLLKFTSYMRWQSKYKESL
jgi:hypothetical protein